MGTTAGSDLGGTGAAVPADTTQPADVGVGDATVANTVRVENVPADNPDADNDDSEGEAYIKAGKRKQEKKQIEHMKSAGKSTEEAHEIIARNKGQRGDEASGGKRQGGKKKAAKKSK